MVLLGISLGNFRYWRMEKKLGEAQFRGIRRRLLFVNALIRQTLNCNDYCDVVSEGETIGALYKELFRYELLYDARAYE
jgi:hypothetical protein